MSEPKTMPDWWAEHEAQTMAEREANQAAFQAGQPVPFPNPWDVWDPSKLPRDAPPEAYPESYRAFTRLCRPKPRKRHVL